MDEGGLNIVRKKVGRKTLCTRLFPRHLWAITPPCRPRPVWEPAVLHVDGMGQDRRTLSGLQSVARSTFKDKEQGSTWGQTQDPLWEDLLR